MPGSFSSDSGLLVICGADLRVSLEEVAGLEPGTLSKQAVDIHGGELCTFTSLTGSDALAATQAYVDFYHSRILDATNHPNAEQSRSPHFFLPVKTGPPAV